MVKFDPQIYINQIMQKKRSRFNTRANNEVEREITDFVEEADQLAVTVTNNILTY